MTKKATLLIFREPGFPVADSAHVSEAALKSALNPLGKIIWADAGSLPAALAAKPDLFITPYGSAFPKEAWPFILEFLKHGGHWLNLGGAPVTRPVRREGNGWHLETAQTSYGKELMIRHTFEIELPSGTQLSVPEAVAPLAGVAKLADILQKRPPSRAWALQVLLTHGTGIMSGEIGSSGTRDAVLRPLVHASAADGRILTAPVVAIDHVNGSFSGGRWILASCNVNWTSELIGALARVALVPLVDIFARPGFASYSIGETPTASVRVSTSAPQKLELNLRISQIDSGKMILEKRGTITAGGADAWLYTEPMKNLKPGFYRICAEAHCAGYGVVARAENGFWIEPEGLIISPAPIKIEGDYFHRHGKPFPVTGTTYMSTVTHRSWMFEPTPLAWEKDFAAMKSAGVNVVRTGLWMGWKRAMTEPGAMDEGVIRAMRAFLLSAAQHNMPVIMTLFAFLPETWTGANPYLDPAAVQAQCSFAAALARRMSDVPHLLWDLINEPSIASPRHLWSCRPTADRFETEAWSRWLAGQGVSDDEWRERWRITSSDNLGLPRLEEFEDRHNWDDAKPLRCMDFVRFAQEIFRQWAATISGTLRACANPPQLITVGQDEGGTSTSPSPHFHADAVDFTSNHSWWQNDDLLWDAVVTKVQGKPHLMEETGIMFAETADSLPYRTPEFVAGLLERKMALAFTCGGAGVIQWLWNTCIYNYSDNEAGIGLLRADGGEKPELQVFRRVSAFTARNAGRFVGRKAERVAVIIPHSNLFSVRETASATTRRCVRTLEYRLGLATRGVSEYYPEKLGDASLIVLPSPRILRQECWLAILEKVKAGATLLLTGYCEADEYWRETSRLATMGIPQKPAPVMHEERIKLHWTKTDVELHVAMPIQSGVIQKFQKAVDVGGGPLAGRVIKYGKGKILFCPVPIEHALAEEHTEAVYRLAADAAGLVCGKRAEFADGGPGLLVRPVEFAESALFILVNESDCGQTANMRGAALSTGGSWQTSADVPANSARLVFLNPRTGKILDESYTKSKGNF